MILLKGAEKIIPTYSVSNARRMKSNNPSYVLVGERFGFKVPGFDFNNSPSILSKANFYGKTVIFTSTNGTLVLKKISGNGKVYISSFLNAEATRISLMNEKAVEIVMSGRPDGSADEDYIYSSYLRKLLLNENPDFEEYAEKIRNSSGARRLRMIGSSDDVKASLKLDIAKFPIVFNGSEIIKEE